MFHPRLPRRALLLGAGATLAAPHVARAQMTDLKVSLSAPYDGSTAPFFLGPRRGFYEQVGLRCQFDTSNGAVEAIGRVGSGAYDFAVGDINVLMDFIANNPAKAPSAIYMLYYRSPLSAITFAKSGITKPADLAGKTLGAAVTDAAYRLFPAFCKQTGLDPNSRQVEVRRPPPARGAAAARRRRRHPRLRQHQRRSTSSRAACQARRREVPLLQRCRPAAVQQLA